MTTHLTTRFIAVLLVVVVSLSGSGCYGAARKSSRIQRDLTSIVEIDPAGRRVEFAAVRAGETVELTATGASLCQKRAVGVAEEITEEVSDLDEENTWTAAGYTAGVGGGVFIPLGAALESPGLLALGLAFVLPLVIAGLSPSKSTSRTYGRAEPFYSTDGQPVPCKDVARAPVAALPVAAKVTFAGASAPLEYRASTGLDGKLQLDLGAALRASFHCGDASLRVQALRDDRFTELLPSAGAFQFPLGANEEPPTSIGALGKLDPAVGAVAYRCCSARVEASARADCEAECASSGIASACLSTRRACLAATGRRAMPEDCRAQFEECLVRIGSSTAALDRCVAACAAPRVARSCR